MEKSSLDRGPDPVRSQNLIFFSLAKVPSVRGIWFKYVNNLMAYTNRETPGITIAYLTISLAEVMQMTQRYPKIAHK